MGKVATWIKTLNRSRWLAILFATTSTVIAACGGDSAPPQRVGILDFLGRDELIDGFQDELAERGYVAGKNVTYVIERSPGDLEGLSAAAERLVAAEVDLIFAISTTATIELQNLPQSKDIPIVFGPVTDPVASGIVESLRAPGGKITGIKTGGALSKLLEWFMELDDDNRTVLYVPHQPDDAASVQGLRELRAAADLLRVELIVEEVSSTEEMIAGVADARGDVDAVVLLPAGFFSLRLQALLAATTARGWPMIGGARAATEGGVLGFGAVVDAGVGHQAGRLAAKILDGTPAADLPVETSRFQLVVNLASAKAIGLELPPSLVAQADIRIRN